MSKVGLKARMVRRGAAVAATALVLAGCVSASASPGRGARGRPKQSLEAASRGSEELETYHYSNNRDGDDTGDPSFLHLRRAWSVSGSRVLGASYAEPLVYGGTVYVVTEDDELYALNARTGALSWSLRVGSPAQAASVQSAPGLSGCGDIFPLGITGTPVIDPATDSLYLVAEEQRPGTSSWTGVEHVMVAVSLSRHRISWRHRVDPPHAGDGSGGTYIVAAEQQRSALSLVRGRLYAEYGGLDGDCSAYHGYVVSLPVSGSGDLKVYKTPSQREDAIWATSGAAANSAGDLYVATGNGSTADRHFEMDNAVIELSPSLRVLGDFAPGSWPTLNADDLDLGSDGPTLLPGGQLIFESGKAGLGAGGQESWGYLLDASRLGGVGHPLYRGEVCPDAGFVFGANAAARMTVGSAVHTVVYVPCPSGTVALVIVGTPRHPSFRRLWQASSGSPNGPPIIAGGLVWALSTGADGGSGSADVLSGMSPTTGRVRVSEDVGPVAHFATPAAGDGVIIVATTDGVEAFRP